MSLDEFLVTRETMLQHVDPEVANGFMETMAAENDRLLPLARMLWRSSLQPEVLQGLRVRWTEEYYATQIGKASADKAERVEKVRVSQQRIQAEKREAKL